MIFGRSYFALHLEFARHVARVRGILLDDALLHYTPAYNHGLQLGKDFDVAHPGWTAFLDALHRGEDVVEYLYEASRNTPPPPDYVPGVCFGYSYYPEWRSVGLNFSNNDPNGIALQKSEMPKRRTELRDTFTRIARDHPEAETVHGGSWLYNLEAYRRLFPPEYVATRHPSDTIPYGFMGAWGQFLNRHFEVKAEMRDPFLACIAAARTMPEIDACFPYRLLREGASHDRRVERPHVQRGHGAVSVAPTGEVRPEEPRSRPAGGLLRADAHRGD